MNYGYARAYLTGTGTYGASNPNSLTFDFVPQLLLFFKNNGKYTWYGFHHEYFVNLYLLTSALTTTYTAIGLPIDGSSGQTEKAYAKKSSDGKTISWYNDYSGGDMAQYQLNGTGYIYHYIAIG